ncbi:hypothetical protein [uncultured Maricaulis sp.]|uniref:hypothetical protein n=1 Tax=uncultured Maricaulis sp. TaxID=174710 RepID=UPI0030DB8C64
MFRTLIIASAILATGGASAALAQQAPDAAAQAAEDAYADQIGRGAEAWANTCSNCHNMRSPTELSPAEWDMTVNHMRVRANIPGDVAEDIKAFLMMSSEPYEDNNAVDSPPATTNPD